MKRLILGLLVLLALGLLVFPAIAEAEKTDCSTCPQHASQASADDAKCPCPQAKDGKCPCPQAKDGKCPCPQAKDGKPCAQCTCPHRQDAKPCAPTSGEACTTKEACPR